MVKKALLLLLLVARAATAAEITIRTSVAFQWPLAAVTNDAGDTLIVWSEGARILAAVLRRTGLTEPISLGGSVAFFGRIAAATDGNGFLVVTPGSNLLGTLIDANGHPLGRSFIIGSGGFPIFLEMPSVAWNGTAYVVTANAHLYVAYNEQRFPRAYAVGATGDVATLKLNAGADAALACDGSRCLIAWPEIGLIHVKIRHAETWLYTNATSATVTDVAIDEGRFVIAWQDDEHPSIYVSRVSYEGDVVDARIEIGKGTDATLAGSLVTWWDPSQNLRAARVEHDVKPVAIDVGVVNAGPIAVSSNSILYASGGTLFMHVDSLARRRSIRP
jgi:hypothetical protein